MTLPPGSLQVIKEVKALTKVLSSIEGATPIEEARKAVGEALKSREASEDTFEYVVRRAMQGIAGVARDEPTLTAPFPLESHLQAVVGLCWSHPDLHGRVQQALMRARFQSGGMICHVCYVWFEAIRLFEGDPRESRRLWKRAQELASTFALDGTDMIRWTYAEAFTRKAP